MREASNGKRRFFDEVVDATPGGEKLISCLQCGTCGGSCPSAAEMDHTPRGIFALIEADMKEEVLASNTPWYCVSCYYCTVRCPQDIPITEIMYTLKGIALEEGKPKRVASDFSETFIRFVESYGRSFEVGLAALYHLSHHPMKLVNMGTGMGMSMFFTGRMGIIPDRIKNIDQLQAILTKAKQIAAGGA